MATEPDRIGPYELAEELGSGGMGTVYRAVDTRTGQAVALKVMDSRLAKDPDYVRRFQREAEIAKKLDSPHIVRVLDSGQDGGQYFLAMEYVKGKNLTEVLRERGKLPPEEARSIATQVAIALEAAHSQGVVHRDIKPGNILMAKDGTAKVADFGIARAVDSNTITKTGAFLGTLSYAAPELLAAKADVRSDIYSLGVVLHQMLSGRVPFEADTPLALIDMHRSQEPPSLESISIRVPADLQAVVTRCLAKRPEERYQNPGEMLLALQGRPALRGATASTGGASGAAPPWIQVRAGADWFGGRRLVYVLSGVGIAGAVLAAVLITAAVTGAWGSGENRAGPEVGPATATTAPRQATPTTLPTSTQVPPTPKAPPTPAPVSLPVEPPPPPPPPPPAPSMSVSLEVYGPAPPGVAVGQGFLVGADVEYCVTTSASAKIVLTAVLPDGSTSTIVPSAWNNDPLVSGTRCFAATASLPAGRRTAKVVASFAAGGQASAQVEFFVYDSTPPRQ